MVHLIQDKGRRYWERGQERARKRKRGSEPGSQGRDFPRMHLLLGAFDGRRRTPIKGGTRDGGRFPRMCRVMAGHLRAGGMWPDHHPEATPDAVSHGPAHSPDPSKGYYP